MASRRASYILVRVISLSEPRMSTGICSAMNLQANVCRRLNKPHPAVWKKHTHTHTHTLRQALGKSHLWCVVPGAQRCIHDFLLIILPRSAAPRKGFLRLRVLPYQKERVLTIPLRWFRPGRFGGVPAAERGRRRHVRPGRKIAKRTVQFYCRRQGAGGEHLSGTPPNDGPSPYHMQETKSCPPVGRARRSESAHSGLTVRATEHAHEDGNPRRGNEPDNWLVTQVVGLSPDYHSQRNRPRTFRASEHALASGPT